MTYSITLPDLERLADIASMLDDANVLPLDWVRRDTVGELHGMVERLLGDDKTLVYPEVDQ